MPDWETSYNPSLAGGSEEWRPTLIELYEGVEMLLFSNTDQSFFVHLEGLVLFLRHIINLGKSEPSICFLLLSMC